MKNKFKYLVSYSLKKKIDSKWFKIVNIILAVLIVFLINMDSIISFFGGDFEATEEIYVVDNNNYFDSFSNYFKLLGEDEEKYNLILDNDKINHQEDLKEEIILVLNQDETSYLNAELISVNTINSQTFNLIKSALAMVKSEIVAKTALKISRV